VASGSTQPRESESAKGCATEERAANALLNFSPGAMRLRGFSFAAEKQGLKAAENENDEADVSECSRRIP